MFGYDKLEMTLPDGSSQGKDSSAGVFREKLRRIVMSCGAQEALTHSVVESALARIAGRECQRVIIRNPLSEDLDSMRVALAPNLLQVVARNQAYAAANVNVFEIGKVYIAEQAGRSSKNSRWLGRWSEAFGGALGIAGEKVWTWISLRARGLWRAFWTGSA